MSETQTEQRVAAKFANSLLDPLGVERGWFALFLLALLRTPGGGDDDEALPQKGSTDGA